jgi:hypothetical protein
MGIDQLHEIQQLLSLAAWYRNWAKLTDSEQEGEQRRALADLMEEKARQLAENYPAQQS